ncbi:MAG: Gfo/Idh/MocA family oxidoreductase [Paenibacillaceae bacterium]
MIRVAILSFWHVHANDYFKHANKHPDTEVVAIWDELPERGRREATANGVAFYESLDELLGNKEIEGVIVTTPTNQHYDVLVAAANAGKHIFTEKVIAPTSQEVKGILHAVERNHVKLTVSLPRLNDVSTLAIQDLLQQGVLGQLTLVRVRLSHNGGTAGWLPEHFFNSEQCGGGAMIDLGCHPMYLTRLFLGMPDRVNANYGYITGREVEDNAVATLSYKNGSIGIVEAGFVNDHSPFSIEIQGTKGTLLYGTPDAKLLVRSSLVPEYANDWVEIKNVPSQGISAFEQWVQHIQQDTIAEENITIAAELTQLIEAANLSNKLKRSVELHELG